MVRLLGYHKQYHGGVHICLYHFPIESSHRFKGQIVPFVTELKPPRSKEIKAFVEVKTIALKEMSHHKFMNFLLILNMEIMEFVFSLEALAISSIRWDQYR